MMVADVERFECLHSGLINVDDTISGAKYSLILVIDEGAWTCLVHMNSYEETTQE